MKKIKFGNWEANDVYVISLDLARLQQEAPNVKMIIGYNIIANHNWYINNHFKSWSVND